ncbi:MAG: hypothetical protein GY750_02095 [Lentisphaerae bacterium]|nr:hypothetical protein [Lentisphaerota bacterium]MCP4100213.1 hypothetical protein [Lentisphaerota bacterium]
MRLISAMLLIVIFLNLPEATAKEIPPANRIIKLIELENASVPSVIKTLRRKYLINVMLRNTNNELSMLPPVSLKFRNVPIWVFIKYFCRDTGMKFMFKSESLYLGTNLKEPPPYYTGDHINKYNVLDKYPDGTRMYIGTVYYLPIGYTAPKVTVSGGGVVTRTSPKPILKKFSTGTSFGEDTPKLPEEEIIKINQAKRKIPRSSLFRPTYDRLFKIKMKVNMEHVPLLEAVRRIQDMSRVYDPEKRGMNIYIEKFKGLDRHELNMVLDRETSLYRIIKYLCLANNLEFKTVPYAVEITTKKTVQKAK